MDLAFTPDELAFRDEIRTWVKDNLPADISQKVHAAMRLTREDMQRWAKILGKKGCLVSHNLCKELVRRSSRFRSHNKYWNLSLFRLWLID